MTTPISELQSANPSAIIELFELELNQAQHGATTVYRFHAGTNESSTNIVFGGNTYTRLPVEADGFEYTGNGQIPRPTIRIANIEGTISAILAQLPNGLEGAKVTRLRTMARYLDDVNFDGGTNPYGTPDSTALLPSEIYIVNQKKAETRQLVEYELAASFDLQNVRVPKRQTIRNACQWKYRTYNGSSFDYTHVDCPYQGSIYYKADDTVTTDPAQDQCGKRLDSCKLRFGYLELTGDVTKGSTTFSVDSGQTAELAKLDPSASPEITGFGIPANTTVTAKTATTLTMSAAATGTSTVTLNGTITANGLAIKMISNATTAGIEAGMVISGAMVPAGTRVSKVSGRIVYLNIDFNADVLTQVYPATAGEEEVGTYTEQGRFLSIGNHSTVAVKDFVIGDDIYEGTKVQQKKSSPTRIRLTKPQGLADGEQTSYAIYEKATRSQASYTFTAPDLFSIKPQSGLPFGSFPGVGQFK